MTTGGEPRFERSRDLNAAEKRTKNEKSASPKELALLLYLNCFASQVFIEEKNSPLVLVERSLSMRNSMPSIVPIGLRIRRSTYTFLS